MTNKSATITASGSRTSFFTDARDLIILLMIIISILRMIKSTERKKKQHVYGLSVQKKKKKRRRKVWHTRLSAKSGRAAPVRNNRLSRRCSPEDRAAGANASGQIDTQYPSPVRLRVSRAEGYNVSINKVRVTRRRRASLRASIYIYHISWPMRIAAKNRPSDEHEKKAWKVSARARFCGWRIDDGNIQVVVIYE